MFELLNNFFMNNFLNLNCELIYSLVYISIIMRANIGVEESVILGLKYPENSESAILRKVLKNLIKTNVVRLYFTV